VPAIVKPKPACANCGATLRYSLSRCPRCGKRSWRNLFRGMGRVG
jgi:predicted amidophosphoribosyltransferase